MDGRITIDRVDVHELAGDGSALVFDVVTSNGSKLPFNLRDDRERSFQWLAFTLRAVGLTEISDTDDLVGREFQLRRMARP